MIEFLAHGGEEHGAGVAGLVVLLMAVTVVLALMFLASALARYRRGRPTAFLSSGGPGGRRRPEGRS